MKISDKVLSKVIRKNLLEMAMDFETPDRPHEDIPRKVKTKDTPIEKVPLPSTGREPEQNFQELLASERYKEIVQRVRRYAGLPPAKTVQGEQRPLIGTAFESLYKIQEIESAHIDELSELAIKTVVDYMGIPEGSVLWDCKIEKPDMAGFQHDKPEDKENPPEVEMESEVELATELGKLNLERAKRRLINAITQGAAARGQYLYHEVEPELARITGKPELMNLYGLLMSILDLQYWQHPDEKIQNIAGKSLEGKAQAKTETDPPTIYARGTSFPILVHEIIKAVMELYSHQGEPADKATFQKVVELEDTLEKEVWDLRLGPPLWTRIRNQFPEEVLLREDLHGLQAYILTQIYKLPAKEFLVLTKEIMSGSAEGKRLVDEIYQSIKKILSGEEAEEETDVWTGDLEDISAETTDEEIVGFVTDVLMPAPDASEAEWNKWLDQQAKKKKEGGTPTPEV